MQPIQARFIGVELYFDDLQKAKEFYEKTLCLKISDEEIGHHAKFDIGGGFICLERKGAESYPSRDKAVLFFEVNDLQSAIQAVGPERFVQREANWAVIHDTEGHNVLFLQSQEMMPKENKSNGDRSRDCDRSQPPPRTRTGAR